MKLKPDGVHLEEKEGQQKVIPFANILALEALTDKGMSLKLKSAKGNYTIDFDDRKQFYTWAISINNFLLPPIKKLGEKERVSTNFISLYLFHLYFYLIFPIKRTLFSTVFSLRTSREELSRELMER